MKRILSHGIIVLLLAAASFARPLTVPFDRAYTVSAIGSTSPVSMFSINGPAPVLYLDLPDAMGQYSYGSSNWFSGSGTTSLFNVYSDGIFTSEGEYWLTPNPEVWSNNKSVGDWRINASYAWWDLVIIYGGGAPVTRATGSTTVNFSIISKPLINPNPPVHPTLSSVPEPSCMLAAIGAVTVAVGRNRRIDRNQG